MGDHFKTDTDELAQFMKTLNDAKTALEEVRKSLQNVAPHGIGTKDLDSACNDFQEHWKYGSEQIAEQTGKLAEGIKQTKSNYEEVETALEDGFRKAAARSGEK
ncbi:hypothetical protein ACYBSK_25560 [Streptomyces sp. BYX5S]